MDNKLKLIRKLYSNCDRYSHCVRLQDYRQAFENLQAFLDVTGELLESDDGFDDQTRNVFLHHLAGIYEAQKSEDWVLIADYFEALIKPVLSERVAEFIQEACSDECYRENLNYNLTMLKIKNEDMYRHIASLKDNGDYVLELSNSGHYTCFFDDRNVKYYVCGNMNPYFDGEILAERYYRPMNETVIIFGLGLGYHCEALSKMDNVNGIEIYEDDIHMIRIAFCASKLEWLWSNDHVKLFYDKDFGLFSERMEKAYRISTDSKETLFIHYPSIRHIKNDGIREYMERLYVSDYSLRRQEGNMYANFVRNVETCRHDVIRLKENFKGKKVIIVAGGPSLDKNIKQIRKGKFDTIILAVGTVFRKLMDLGIRPDYVIIAESSPFISRQFDGLFDCGVPLLMLSTACKDVGVRYSGEKYLLCQEDYAEAEKLAKKETLPLFASGGSVSTTALDVCIRMGCKSIIFVGLDLAFTEGKSHSSGTIQAERVNTEGWIQQKGYEWVEESENDHIVYREVYTTRNLNMYNEWISSRVKKSDVTMPVYDATEGGAVIDGLKIVRLIDLLD